MFNPFGIIMELSTIIVDTIEENEELRRKEMVEERRRRQEREYQKRKREEEIWRAATDEAFNNPEEWEVLPYGWSPFGISL